MSADGVVIALDGGQSSTTCLVGDLAGRPLGWARGGPIWHIGEPGGQERVRAAVAGSITVALDRADRRPRDVRQAFLALTGSAEAGAAVARDVLPAADVVVGSDALAALASGTLGGPGTVLVAGTGTVSLAIDAAGRTTYRGGWGPTLGDDGGAYWIGLRALRAAVRAADGYGPPTRLLPRIRDELALSDARELFDLVYTGRLDRSRIAALAPHVAALAGDGDALSAAILDRAIEALARLAVATARAAALDGAGRRIVLSGGVLLTNQRIADGVAAALGAELPDHAIIRPHVPPVVGAYALALAASGVDAAAVLTPLIAAPGWPDELSTPTHRCTPKGERP